MRFKIGRLYFRYILRTKLENFGYTALKLGRELEPMGYVRVDPDGEHYTELRTLPRKRQLVEMLIDLNNLEAPLMGKVLKYRDGKGEILGTNKKTYMFDSEVVLGGPIQEGDKVKFKTAYTVGKINCARHITKESA